MSSFSIDAVWEDAIAFLRRESALILPIALATFGLGTVVLGLGVEPASATPVDMGLMAARLLWFIPALLLTLIGNMAISVVVLRPRASVGESLRVALGRTPVAIAIMLLLMVAAMGVLVAATFVVTLLGLVWPMNMPARLSFTIYAALIPTAWLTIRLLVMWPTVADSDTGPVDSLRKSFRLTRGHALKALTVSLTFGAVYILLVSIAQLALTPVIRLLGLAIGQLDLLQLIGQLVIAFIGSVLMMGWTVYLAFLYRRLTA
ncbi:MAG: hypothetical protein JWR77_836 [Rhizorhabdus sp.]|nr:hypothetical protein [Rhizorhabdus sp.]